MLLKKCLIEYVLANLSLLRGVKKIMNSLSVQEGVFVALGMELDERVCHREGALRIFRENGIYLLIECMSRIYVGSSLKVVGNQMFQHRTSRRRICL